MTPRIPPSVWAVLEALRIGRTSPPPLPDSWEEAFAFADRTQLTLSWRARLAADSIWHWLPESVRRRLDQNRADNTERLRRIRELSTRIASRFDAARVEYVGLKGLAHSAAFADDPCERVQYDLDYFCPPESASRAREVLLDMGYEPLTAMEEFPTDHLPVMVLKTGWRWRGNYFDPDHPPSIDLHFRFWDAETEQVRAPGVELFWQRRVGAELDLLDQLGYAALHALRHLLRGSLRPAHLYEIARFLENRRSDATFWSRWRQLHDAELRALESIVFGLAHAQFGCASPEELPTNARAWIDRYAWSPVEGLFRPNKHELLLHWTMVGNRAARRRILWRRLAPFRLPGPVDAMHVPDEQITLGLRLRRGVKYAAFVGSRVVFHARVLLPTLWALARRRARP